MAKKTGQRVMWRGNQNDAGTVTDAQGSNYIVKWDDGKEAVYVGGSAQDANVSEL